MVTLGHVQAGFSKKLAYMAKTQRLAIGCLHEVYFGESLDLLDESDENCENILTHVDGKKNPADLFTKALPAEKHWWCCEEIGLVAIPDELVKFAHSKPR